MPLYVAPFGATPAELPSWPLRPTPQQQLVSCLPGAMGRITDTPGGRVSTIPFPADLAPARRPLHVWTSATSSGKTPSYLPRTPSSFFDSRPIDFTSTSLPAGIFSTKAAVDECDPAGVKMRSVRRPSGEAGAAPCDRKWLSYHRAHHSLNEAGIG